MKFVFVFSFDSLFFLFNINNSNTHHIIWCSILLYFKLDMSEKIIYTKYTLINLQTLPSNSSAKICAKNVGGSLNINFVNHESFKLICCIMSESKIKSRKNIQNGYC